MISRAGWGALRVMPSERAYWVIMPIVPVRAVFIRRRRMGRSARYEDGRERPRDSAVLSSATATPVGRRRVVAVFARRITGGAVRDSYGSVVRRGDVPLPLAESSTELVKYARSREPDWPRRLGGASIRTCFHRKYCGEESSRMRGE